MSRVDVKEEVLLWAVDRSGKTLNDLQGKFPKIKEWATGESQPTLKQLESLAKTTMTPFGFFFLEKPPEERLTIPFFRTLGYGSLNKPSPDLIETIQMMQQRQTWMREFLIDQGTDRLQFVRSVQIGEQPSSVAQRMRRVLGFDERSAAQQPTWTKALMNLREAMEAVGIMVVVNGVVGNNTHRNLDVSEFRGFVLVDEYAPLMFVNGADGKAAQMFTLAHELAHIFFGSSAAFDLRKLQPANDPTEKACNNIAAEFLVPELQLRNIWPSVRESSDHFQALARYFKVSELVAARRALDLHLIGKNDFLEFYQAYLDKVHGVAKRGEGGDFYATQNLRIGKLFASAVVRAVREGKLLYHDAYHLTGLYGRAFEGYSESLGFGASR
ncbi:MAG: ImmA/IrrE family metallo-endopeptidase [Candidatus Zixiibacteriota bacterium]